MLNFEGKYGNVHVDEMTKKIDDLSIDELKKCLEQLEKNEIRLYKKQNKYISQIIE